MNKTPSTPLSVTPDNAFSPLRHRLFAVIWAATIIGSIGSFVRDVTSAWLVTDLSSSPAAVAMVQAAATLPVFLLAIPAGVLSDMLDRRKLLICVQLLLASVSVCLVILSLIDQHSVASLIMLTFIGGIGVALMGPTWQAIVPELVDKKDFKNAVGLNSLGINIARAVGPALGGLLLASMGAAFTYGVDVLSYAVVIAALIWWKRPATQRDALSERFPGAFRAGLRYARASHELHVVLLRAFLFFAMASSVWALLPLVARQLLEGGPGFYGILLGAVGLGAIGGAVIMPRLRMYLSADGLLLTSALVTSAVMALLSLAPPKWLAVSSLLILGAAWITALTTLNGVAQAILPNWVRGRSLAVYLTVFNGALAAGSLAWGVIAQGIGVPLALLSGAAGLAAIGCIAHRIKLPKGETDLMPSNHWPEPLTATPVEYDQGPVLIQIEYRVALEDRSAFLKILSRLSAERRRDGAYAWGITEDSSDPSLLLEWFQVESWAEHLRQHKRVSRSAADIQEEVRRFHQGEERPVVRHFLTFNHPDEGRA